MLKFSCVVVAMLCVVSFTNDAFAQGSPMPTSAHPPDPPGSTSPYWSPLPFTDFSALETVDRNGNSTYPSNQFPIKLVGIVLNNPGDMTDSMATPATAQPPALSPFNPNPYWQIFVQTVNINNDGDFGGAAVYASQNYANIPPYFFGDPSTYDPGLSYSTSGWVDDVNRISNNNTIQAGDLVMIEAQGGLDFGGKFNINEEHEINPNTQFNMVVLSHIALPDPTPLHLADIWDNSTNTVLFDPTRATGGEHYQSTLVRLEDVQLVPGQAANWQSNGFVTVEDNAGRPFTVQLGTNSAFTPANAPTGLFNVTGIFDQEGSPPFGSTTGSYEVWVMDPTTVSEVRVLGDFSFDGQLDSADVLAMENALADLPAYEFNHDLTPADTLAIGDINHDGVVNNADLQALLNLLKPSGVQASATVPEPPALALLGLAAALASVARLKISDAESKPD